MYAKKNRYDESTPVDRRAVGGALSLTGAFLDVQQAVQQGSVENQVVRSLCEI